MALAAQLLALERVFAAFLETLKRGWGGLAALILGMPTGAQETLRRGSSNEQLIDTELREAVARDHGLRLHDVLLIPAGTTPKTSSGKIRRRKCMNIYLARLRAAPDEAVGALMRAPKPTEADHG